MRHGLRLLPGHGLHQQEVKNEVAFQTTFATRIETGGVEMNEDEMNEDEIIAAYIRQEYPEILETSSFIIFRTAYMLITPVAKCFIEIFNKVFGGNAKDE